MFLDLYFRRLIEAGMCEVPVGRSMKSHRWQKHRARRRVRLQGDLCVSCRYAQLVPIMMPGWRMRVYVEDTTNGELFTVYVPVNKVVLRKLDHIGVEIIRLDNVTASELVPDLWPLLIMDDSNVNRWASAVASWAVRVQNFVQKTRSPVCGLASSDL